MSSIWPLTVEKKLFLTAFGMAVILVTSLGLLAVGAVVVTAAVLWGSVARARAHGDGWQRRLAFRLGAVLLALLVVVVLLNPPE